MSAGTLAPGTSLFMNSALRYEVSGQMPQSSGIFTCSTRFMKRSRMPTSNTGCVIMYSAPASIFQSRRRSSSSRLIAPGFTPTPMLKPVGSPMAFPARSRPWFSRLIRLTRPIASTSNTAVACG